MTVGSLSPHHATAASLIIRVHSYKVGEVVSLATVMRVSMGHNKEEREQL